MRTSLGTGAASLAAILVAVVLFAGSARPATAQVNTEKMRSFNVDGFQTTIGGTVAYQSGNADLIEVGARARFDVRHDRHYGFLTSEVRYGEEDGRTFRDRSFAHLRYTYRVLPWLVPETFSQVEQNGFTLLQLRVLAGMGVRLRYLDTERVKVFQGTTPMYEFENLNASEITRHPTTVSTVRWSNYVNVRLKLTDKTYFVQTAYVQPRFDAFSDVRILDEARLAIAITKHVTLDVSLEFSYDSRPPDGVSDFDLSLRNGVSVSF